MGATASCKKTNGSGYPDHDDPGYRKCQELKVGAGLPALHNFTNMECP